MKAQEIKVNNNVANANAFLEKQEWSLKCLLRLNLNEKDGRGWREVKLKTKREKKNTGNTIKE